MLRLLETLQYRAQCRSIIVGRIINVVNHGHGPAFCLANTQLLLSPIHDDGGDTSVRPLSSRSLCDGRNRPAGGGTYVVSVPVGNYRRTYCATHLMHADCRRGRLRIAIHTKSKNCGWWPSSEFLAKIPRISFRF